MSTDVRAQHRSAARITHTSSVEHLGADHLARSTQMYALHEALARERMRDEERRSRRGHPGPRAVRPASLAPPLALRPSRRTAARQQGGLDPGPLNRGRDPGTDRPSPAVTLPGDAGYTTRPSDHRDPAAVVVSSPPLVVELGLDRADEAPGAVPADPAAPDTVARLDHVGGPAQRRVAVHARIRDVAAQRTRRAAPAGHALTDHLLDTAHPCHFNACHAAGKAPQRVNLPDTCSPQRQ